MTAPVTLRWPRGGLTRFPPVPPPPPPPSGYAAGITCFHGERNVRGWVRCRFTIRTWNEWSAGWRRSDTTVFHPITLGRLGLWRRRTRGMGAASPRRIQIEVRTKRRRRTRRTRLVVSGLIAFEISVRVLCFHPRRLYPVGPPRCGGPYMTVTARVREILVQWWRITPA